MKPLYVWDSKKPWNEIQLQAFGAYDDASPYALVVKGGLNILWFALLFRTLGLTVKRYVQLSKLYYMKLSETEMMQL